MKIMTEENRNELCRRIYTTVLSSGISKKLNNLAVKYGQARDNVVKLFYNMVCEPRFDVYEDDDERFDKAFESFIVEFSERNLK
jgi:hypothetical protein